MVAPHAGAWIEIGKVAYSKGNKMSHLTQVRGLKSNHSTGVSR
ncbi:Hypothetical protein SFBmNL_00736 [Candidatus Arthromitus sp. SFB-mouse-NL]|nr:Hypothetical protein SFBmNL_00736 [Candidatus Arthromitus sp. SFB-mouse-NL]